MTEMSPGARRMAERRLRIVEAEKVFKAYLASPASDDLEEFLLDYLQALPLMRDTPEATAYQLGLYEAIQQIRSLQQTARGIYK